MTFPYRALDTARREIRLLRLLASDNFDAPLRCELLHASLEDAPVYEAVSYVWGKPLFTQPIELDGQPFAVTVNLEVVLRYLRKEREDRVLWVDAICINQEDPTERSHQVSLMKTIYSSCTTDLAWLGPNPALLAEAEDECSRQRLVDDFERIPQGIDLMRKLRDRDVSTLELLTDNMHKRRGDGEGWLLEYAQDAMLMSLFYSPALWSRIWVMQELSCAPTVTLVSAHSTLDWDAVVDFIGDTEYVDALHVPGGHGSVESMSSRQRFRRVETIQHQRSIMRDAASKGYESKLMDVLARFRYAQSSDLRDKIYGLLGLVTEKHGIRVDYKNKDVGDVFADVTKFLIDSAGSLDILCQNPWQINDGDTKTPGLATWVADYSYAGSKSRIETFSGLLFAQRGIYTASTRPCDVPCQVREGQRLRLRGAIIDEHGPVLQDDFQEPKPRQLDWVGNYFTIAPLLPLAWLKLYFQSPEAISGRVYAPTGEPLLQAYCRTLAGDCTAFPVQRLEAGAIEAEISTLGALMQEVERESQEKREVKEGERVGRWIERQHDETFKRLSCERMMRRMLRDFTFALTRTGLMAMVRKGAREGDVLAAVEGGKVPFLLRPVEGAGGGESGMDHEFVNVAYVHGFMDGEAEKLVMEGRLKMQEFDVI